MAVALALPLEPVVDIDAPHLGPAEAFDGGVAHVDFSDSHLGLKPFRFLWYSVPDSPRPCPFCGEPFVYMLGTPGRNATLGINDRATDPRERFRWYHPVCAVQASGSRITGMAVGQPGRGGVFAMRERPACAKCGGRWHEDHVHGAGGVWCDDACTIAYEEPVT